MRGELLRYLSPTFLGFTMLMAAQASWAQTFNQPAQSNTNYVVQQVPPNTYLTGSLTLNVPNSGVAFGDAELTLPNNNFWDTSQTPPLFLGSTFGFLGNPGTTTGSFSTCADPTFYCANGFPQQLKLYLANFSVPNAPPVTATLNIHQNPYAKMIITPEIFTDGGIQVLAKAIPASAGSLNVNLDTAAQGMGYNHFNWVQTIVSSDTLNFCQLPGAINLPVCQNVITVNGTVPKPPTVDPPFGGWGYQGASPGNPVRDSLPGYWDESFGGCGGEIYAHYEKPVGGKLLGCQSPTDPNTFVEFEDKPSVPGLTIFDTSLAGVGCSFIGTPANCNTSRFDLIPGTQFQYSVVGTGGAAQLFAGDIRSKTINLLKDLFGSYPQNAFEFQAGDGGSDTTSLSGYQLSNFDISLNQFITDSGGLDALAADGVGVAPDSVLGGLDPQDAAVLAQFNAGGGTQPVPEPGSLPLFASGMLLLLLLSFTYRKNRPSARSVG